MTKKWLEKTPEELQKDLKQYKWLFVFNMVMTIVFYSLTMYKVIGEGVYNNITAFLTITFLLLGVISVVVYLFLLLLYFIKDMEE